MSLGQTIARLRKQKGYSRKELAALLDVDPSYVTRWERYSVQPRPKALERLAEVLETSVAELYAGELVHVSGALRHIEDPRLMELLGQVHRFSVAEREALKTFMEAILTRVQLEEVVDRHPKQPRTETAQPVASQTRTRGRRNRAPVQVQAAR
ncbi:MAG: helix-turn-helix transcriptional regulator [Candidatus Eremiobacterota bacterium]